MHKLFEFSSAKVHKYFLCFVYEAEKMLLSLIVASAGTFIWIALIFSKISIEKVDTDYKYLWVLIWSRYLKT